MFYNVRGQSRYHGTWASLYVLILLCKSCLDGMSLREDICLLLQRTLTFSSRFFFLQFVSLCLPLRSSRCVTKSYFVIRIAYILKRSTNILFHRSTIWSISSGRSNIRQWSIFTKQKSFGWNRWLFSRILTFSNKMLIPHVWRWHFPKQSVILTLPYDTCWIT